MADVDKNGENKFSLGLEELALGLGMINRPDLGRQLILSIYDQIQDQQIEERLTSASHSLIARGLCGMTNTGSAILREDLELVLFPLAKFDYILQVSIVKGYAQADTNIHVIRNRMFTSHFADIGVVHTLENGNYENLARYIQEIFTSAISVGLSTPGIEFRINLGLLGKALNLGSDYDQIVTLFKHSGLSKDHAELLANDIAHQVLRGSILRVDASSEMDEAQAIATPHQILLFLHGPRHTWAFEFHTVEDDATGTASIINQLSLPKMVGNFVN